MRVANNRPKMEIWKASAQNNVSTLNLEKTNYLKKCLCLSEKGL
jgi:hypothetical protein